MRKNLSVPLWGGYSVCLRLDGQDVHPCILSNRQAATSSTNYAYLNTIMMLYFPIYLSIHPHPDLFPDLLKVLPISATNLRGFLKLDQTLWFCRVAETWLDELCPSQTEFLDRLHPGLCFVSR